MSATELTKFKDELKNTKSVKTAKKKEKEAERVRRAKEEIENEPDNEEEFLQEAEPGHRSESAEIERIETIHTVREAIEHLKKHAPQYSEFLDYISGIRFYDDVLVQLADTLGSKTLGTNKFKFNEKQSTFTNSIVISRNSFGYQTLMHELVHAFTVVALRYDNGLYEDIKTQMNFLQDSIGKSRLSRELGSYAAAYAFENPYEFIAEFFSNPKLQQLAKEASLPETAGEKKTSVFAKIINFIVDKFKSLFGKKTDSFYNDLKNKLYSVVDRQIELQESEKMIFKSKDDFEVAKNLAAGASVDGVFESTKIPTVEQDFNYRYAPMPFDDDVLVPSPGIFMGSGKFLTLSQLINANDQYSSLAGMKRFVNSKNLYRFNSGTDSSLFGVRDDYSGAFVVVRANIASGDDYAALLRTAAESNVPIVIAAPMNYVFHYTAFGFHPVHSSEVDGKVFMGNDAFNDEHLYKLGTTYRPFADVLDSNDNFINLRRGRYSDQEWNKFSEMEKYHARKCIGI